MILASGRLVRPCLLVALALPLAAAAAPAAAQTGYYASIAYSQTTGRVGYSARQARTRQSADQLAIRMCRAPDAKVFMWARDQWVAIAVVDGHVGTAGFGRGETADEAQQNALAECGKRAQGHAYRVVLCVHSGGRRVEELQSVAAAPVKSKTGYFAAIAFSRATGKVGQTAGMAKTIDEAKQLALKDCDAPDAKVYMWGDQWIAIAVAPSLKGVAGFGPGATREDAEKVALDQCRLFSHGAESRVELCIYSTGEEKPAIVPAAAEEAPPAASRAPLVRQAR